MKVHLTVKWQSVLIALIGFGVVGFGVLPDYQKGIVYTIIAYGGCLIALAALDVGRKP